MKTSTRLAVVGILFSVMMSIAGIKELSRFMAERAQVQAKLDKKKAIEEAAAQKKAAKDKEDVDYTSSFVKELVEIWGTKKTNLGAYIRPTNSQIADIEENNKEQNIFNLRATDAWKHQMRLVYNRGPIQESLIVRSAGLDGKYNTEDDIIEETYSTNGVGAGTAVKEGVSDLFQGAYKKLRGK